MSDPVLIEQRGRIAIVTLNLPEKRNALGPTLYPALSRALTGLQDDRHLRALVLYGGPHFCAGGDLSVLGAPGLEMRQAMSLGHRAIRALIEGPLPAIAAVEGSAFGAGFSLAMACDLVVADESARFCAAFGRVGLTPDYGLLWTLPQRVGMGIAKEILLLGEPIDALQAAQWRLIDRLADKGQVLQTALALAEKLTDVAPATVTTTKAALSRHPLSVDAMLAWEADTQALLAGSDDTREGIKAFSERRPPRFEGR